MACAAAIAVAGSASMVILQARAVARKVSGVRAGMSFADVSRQLDGWAMFNAHQVGKGTQGRANLGPEYFGYSGEVYVLTPVEADGRETDLRKISRPEFEQRMERLVSDGEPWTVYFSFAMIGPDTGVLVRFGEGGKVADNQP
jgi:hypothetical protein